MPLNDILSKIINSSSGIIGAVLGDSEGERIAESSKAGIVELDALCAYTSVLMKQILSCQGKMKIGSFSRLSSLNKIYNIHIVPFKHEMFLAIITDKNMKPVKLEHAIQPYIEELKRGIE